MTIRCYTHAGRWILEVDGVRRGSYIDMYAAAAAANMWRRIA